jgi:hypothetical protein
MSDCRRLELKPRLWFNDETFCDEEEDFFSSQNLDRVKSSFSKNKGWKLLQQRSIKRLMMGTSSQRAAFFEVMWKNHKEQESPSDIIGIRGECLTPKSVLFNHVTG